jgi:hypothetical protein
MSEPSVPDQWPTLGDQKQDQGDKPIDHDLSKPPKPCSACGHGMLQPGFVEDTGQAAQGASRWIPGFLERGLFGGARVMGKVRVEIQAWRCARCYHLDLYARE